jgi:hypothetical protein
MCSAFEPNEKRAFPLGQCRWQIATRCHPGWFEIQQMFKIYNVSHVYKHIGVFPDKFITPENWMF